MTVISEQRAAKKAAQEKANVDYVEVQHSVSTVDHGWFTKLKHENKKIEIQY